MSEYLVDNELDGDAIIKVVGVGGGGGNAVDYMLDKKINGVQFININTDAQALRKSEVDNKLRIGENVTRGLGAGSNPSVGAQVAEAEKDKIEQEIAGADMIFIAAGMGGGTGTGAAPVVAEIAEKLNILTVAVVTKPFFFEGPKREKYAVQGIERLSEHVDSLIVVPNDKLLETGEAQGGSLLDGFACANNVLYGAVQGIAELITCPGMMNVDFADVKTVMSDAGVSMMGTGEASGENRAEEATMNAINSPLLEDVELTGAKGVLVNITCSSNLKIAEFRTIGQIVTERASEDATVKVGTVFDDSLGDEMIVTVVATGLESNTAAPATKNIIQEHAPVNIEQEAKKKKDRPFFLRGFTDK